MSKSKTILSLITGLVLAMSLLLVGCGGGGGATNNAAADSGSGAAAPAATELRTVTPGVLTVGSDCDYPPFIEMNGEQPQGFEFDLLTAITAEMGYELEYLPPQNFDTLLASVASETKMDLGCSSFTINDERKKLIDFCTPYFDSNQAVVALIDAPYTNAMDFNGKVVGAQSGTTGADWVRENLTDSGTTLKEYNQTSEVMAALVAGDIEGAFYDEPVAAEWASTLYTNTHIVESIPTGEQYGFAVSKGNPELLQAINDTLVIIKQNGTFDRIFAEYFPDLTPPTLGVAG
ncbi:MAG: ABC transporter substrate-binding protein [Coriobacteriales bacterium]|jgi:polar amino acid transport system substrate-binding protein|nr:ABC transporter substrate-binding protein [Coriobacteriales bacterium]